MVTFGNMEEGNCADVEIREDLIGLDIDSDEFGLKKLSFVSSDGKTADIGQVNRISDEKSHFSHNFVILGSISGI